VRSTPAGQTDFAPTLLALLGIDATPLPYVGRNLLGVADGIVVRPYGAWLDDRHLFLTRGAQEGMCVDVATTHDAASAACRQADAAARRAREVSRLARVRTYRRRKGEAKVAASISQHDFGSADQPRFPYIPVGLYLSVIAQARRHGIETLFMLTEPRLAKHLSHLGVDIHRIGGPVEHRGQRVPSMLSVEGVVRGLNFAVRPLYDVIAREVDAAYGANAPSL